MHERNCPFFFQIAFPLFFSFSPCDGRNYFDKSSSAIRVTENYVIEVLLEGAHNGSAVGINLTLKIGIRSVIEREKGDLR